ncbi:MAG: hypothetical protein COA79_19250 [Planctomycetota bacterium]|nr:MAG: hypothetical protein COA79_19250 [Planctomycetota bacterium]
MVKITQIDIACGNPKELALWHGNLLGIEIVEMGNELFHLPLEGSEIHFVKDVSANVEAGTTGIHQFHFELNQNIDEIVELCNSNNLKPQIGKYGNKGQSVFIWDPENNPIILFPAEKIGS